MQCISFIQCNGLESNEKFLEEKIVRKNIFVKKIFEIFFLQSLEIFQSSEVWKCSEVSVKNNFVF